MALDQIVHGPIIHNGSHEHNLRWTGAGARQ